MQPNQQAPYSQPPQMEAHSQQKRHVDVWMVAFFLALLLFLSSVGFGIWAYMSRQDYKYNTDQKVSAAVDVAKKETSDAKDKEFLEKEKYPYKTYAGPQAYGSIVVKYPKTWGAYVEELENYPTPVEGYFNPGFVPGLRTKTPYALRLEVASDSYSAELKRFDSNIKEGTIRSKPYRVPKVKKVLGTMLTGEISTGIQGIMVLVPMRDKTLKIWTEANDFAGDFNKIILANLTFSP